jgi:hypothetical protein
MGPLLSGPIISECPSKCLRAEGGSPSNLSQQPPPMQVTSDCKGEGDAFLRVGEREMSLTLLRDSQQVLEPSDTVATVSSFSLGEYGPFLKKVRTKGCLPPSAWYVHMECHGPSLQPTTSSALACNSMVFLNRKRILGALSFCHSVAQPEPPTLGQNHLGEGFVD